MAADRPPLRDWTDTAGGTAGWLASFAELQGRVDELVGQLTALQLNWKPSPERWSAGECVAHLTIFHRHLVPLLDSAIARARAGGRLASGPFRYGACGRFFVRAVAPSGRRRLRAAKGFRPSPGRLEPADVLVEFARWQLALRLACQRAEGLDLAAVRVASPVVPLLRLQLGIWFAATAAHQARHLAQVERLLAEPTFPRG